MLTLTTYPVLDCLRTIKYSNYVSSHRAAVARRATARPRGEPHGRRTRTVQYRASVGGRPPVRCGRAATWAPRLLIHIRSAEDSRLTRSFRHGETGRARGSAGWCAVLEQRSSEGGDGGRGAGAAAGGRWLRGLQLAADGGDPRVEEGETTGGEQPGPRVHKE